MHVHVDNEHSHVAMNANRGPVAVDSGRKTRVLLLTNSVQMGGMEEHVRMLSEQLDRHQFDVHAVVPDCAATAPFTAAMRVAADEVHLITPDRRNGVIRQIADAVRLTRHVRRECIDVVHLHSTSHLGENLAAICARLGGARAIYVSEHLAPVERLSLFERPIRDIFSRCVTGIVCVSLKNYRARSAWITTPLDKTVVIPNGVDMTRFDPIDPAILSSIRARHQIPDHATVVGTAVRFEPGKGLHYLIDAFEIVYRTHPDAVLMMVGEGLLHDELVAQAHDRGISDAVRFVDFQPDPRPYLQAMDIFVLPVPNGSMSIGLLEAMASGLPCVMTFGGEGEAVVHGENGYCAEPRDPASIAHFVEQLIDDPQARAQIGAAARRRIAEHFSSRIVAATLGSLYLYGPKSIPRPS